MITIEFTQKNMMLEMKGHSDTQKCAGVSALFGALAFSLSQAFDADMLKEHADIKEEDGDCFISCVPKDEYKECVDTIYSVILGGLVMISLKYPSDVKLVRNL